MLGHLLALSIPLLDMPFSNDNIHDVPIKVERHAPVVRLAGTACSNITETDENGDEVIVGQFCMSYISGTAPVDFGGGGSGDGSGDNGPLPPGDDDLDIDLQCRAEQVIERGRDAAAMAFRNWLVDNANWTEWEYGALIYQAEDGSVRLGPINTNRSPIGVDIITTDQRDGERIVGDIHNHPDFEDYYSPRLSLSDIGYVRSMEVAGLIDPSNYSSYLVLGNGMLAEFDLDDFFEQTSPEHIFDADGACEDS